MNSLPGTGSLVRLALRRSWMMLAGCVGALALVAAVSATATVDLYPSEGLRIAAASAVNDSRALVALFGRIYDPSSIGAIAMIKTGSVGSVFVALVTIALVVRHTRADEEAGRTELLGATVMGRRAPLAAAFVVALIANAALAVVTAAALATGGLPLEGSLAFGCAWAGVGLAFAAVAAVAAQLARSARGATALSATILAVVYVLRALGDASGTSSLGRLSWLSPIGWAQQFRPYAGNRWWVLLVMLGFALVVAAAAFALAARRDLGAGLFSERSGRARAPRLLRGPLALAWRLQWRSLVGWAVGFALVGALLGGMAHGVGDFINNPSAREFITRLGGEKALSDAFLALELSFAGIVAAAYGIQAVTRLRSEETGLRAEPVLATGTGRVRWAMSHIWLALAGAALLMALIGIAAGLAYGAQTGDPGQAGRVIGAALVQVPAAWVLPALVVFAFGAAPRFVAVGWVALAAFVVLGELGPLLGLSDWVMDLSPFAVVPRLPGGPFSVTPLLWLTAVAALLGAAGLAALRRRDVGSA